MCVPSGFEGLIVINQGRRRDGAEPGANETSVEVYASGGSRLLVCAKNKNLAGVAELADA